MRALRFLLRKEFLQLFRDPAIVRLLVMIPIVQLIVLANAATFEVKRARMHVVDLDRSTMSRGAVDRLVASGRFVASEASGSTAQGDDALMRRTVELVLAIPAGFERDLVRDRRGEVQLLMNAEDGAAAGVTQAYARQILAAYAAELQVRLVPAVAVGRARPEAPPARGVPRVEVRSRGWYNAELDYRHYMVPGILVQLLTIVGTLLTALNIVREKEAGTLDQLNVTPVSRGVFITAKLLPLWLIAMVVLSIGLTVARFVFGVPMEGSLVLVCAGAALYLVAALGIGLWVSTVTETQQQAMFVNFSILMVYLLMSGLFTPVSAMPHWAQVVANVNPMRHFITLMRAVLLKGAGLPDVAPQLVVLAVSGVVVLAVAMRQYHKRAD
ncbi:MAG: ABC transporter permease [Gemmatimonadaceae bacterium]|nr:ABC transporter permease [Gemmatimonadaceae bacterium]